MRRAKYKNRFNTAIFLLLLFAALNIAGSFLSSFYFNRGGENSLLYRTQKTAALLTEFTFPNVTMPLSFVPSSSFFSRAGWGHSSVEIKPYFYIDVDITWYAVATGGTRQPTAGTAGSSLLTGFGI